MLKVLDLFSGIGGFSLGLERTGGFETVAFCEIEEFPRKVLAKHWPEVPCFEDVRTLKGSDIGTVDVICGGYPCQPFSTAGKRRGKEDDRHLWPEFMRLVVELRPTWVIGENVAGHISMGLDDVLSDLEAEGYSARAFVIPACAKDAKHRRDRVWTVGYSEKLQRNGKQHYRKTRTGQIPELRAASSKDTVANTTGTRLSIRRQPEREAGCAKMGAGVEPWIERRCEALANPQRIGQPGQGPCGNASNSTPPSQGQTTQPINGGYGGFWPTEPNVGRGLDEFPLWLDGIVGRGMNYEESQRSYKKLQDLWSVNAARPLQWASGGLGRIQKAEVLFYFLRKYEEGTNEARLLLAGKEASEGCLRGLRLYAQTTGTPHRPRHKKQRTNKHSDPVQTLSRFLAHDGQEGWEINSWEDAVPRVAQGVPHRVDRLKALGNAVVPQIPEMIGYAILEAEAERA